MSTCSKASRPWTIAVAPEGLMVSSSSARAPTISAASDMAKSR